ncbi:dicarboxylate--CoA ligase PimA [Hoeflea sp. WL0058]|uniref:Long-chain-fatty-acid--CoA ligase n=1 Tax=Flavimaribacter sediminis TaxID=2865987 RepID=A0AAE2ZKX5_9HYPH|nr:dicarboxylate--CoA ligase PimA [Flavimaribacter sediminis]MBW8638418.1 dicarboxylate--CoA ligase PimA [Flavimaribacter sediminis]
MNSRPYPWEQFYPPGLRWDCPIPASTVPQLLEAAAAADGDRTVVHFRDWTISYKELQAQAEKLAASLLAKGYGGDRCIALYMPNSPYHLIAFFGILRAGARVVHLSPLDARRELAHKMTDSGAQTIVTTNVGGMFENAVKLMEDGLAGTVIVGDDAAFGDPGPARDAIIERDGVIRFDEFCSAPVPPEWPAVGPDDIALLQYTGGTTGLPKGAILTHANLSAAVSQYDAWYSGLYGRPDETEIVLCVLPLFHIYALSAVMLLSVKRQCELVLHMRFDAGKVLEDIERRKITSFPGVPTMWIAIVNHPDLMNRDISSLQRCASGGAPLPIEVGQRFEKLTGQRLAGGWGMTETSPSGTNLLPFGETRHGSIGIPLPGIELQIVSLEDPHRILSPGEIGELRIKGKNVTRGYWNRPQETASSFADGFFLTGDVGYMAEDGFFYIVDRKKDMIISGGFNVYPQMIEQAIYEHPAVAECIVIGAPDSYRGEVAKAFVTLKAGADTLTLEELQSFLSDKLGRHEMPGMLEIRDALPKTPVGKLSRKELRQEELSRAAGAAKDLALKA